MIVALLLGCFIHHVNGAVSKLRIAICFPPENPPYEVRQPDGTFVGYDVDVWNHVYANLRTQAMLKEDAVMMDLVGTQSSAFIPMPFSHILTNITENRVDVGLCNVFVTPDRAKHMDFTAVYIQTGLVAVVRSRVAGSIPMSSVSGVPVLIQNLPLCQELMGSAMFFTGCFLPSMPGIPRCPMRAVGDAWS